MRYIKLLYILLILITLMSCQTPIDEQDNGDLGNSNSNGSILKNIKAMDSNNEFIGYAINFGAYTITLMSENGYLYNISWDGTISSFTSSTLYFTEIDGGGTPIGSIEGKDLYAKGLFYGNDTFYKIVSSENNLGTSIDTTTDIESKLNIDGTFTNYNYSVISSGYAQYYTLQVITPPEIGIPDTIIPPITLEFE